MHSPLLSIKGLVTNILTNVNRPEYRVRLHNAKAACVFLKSGVNRSCQKLPDNFHCSNCVYSIEDQKLNYDCHED